MLFELILRNETPVILRVALLATLAVVGIIYSFIPQWFSAIRTLATLPVQRFAWQSEAHRSSSLFRLGSIISITAIYTLFIFTHLYSQKLVLLENSTLNFLLIWLVITMLTLAKFLLNKYYFSLHNESNLGDLIIDYQYSINQFFAFIVGIFLVVDVFYFGLISNLYIIAIVGLLILFLIKLFGVILLLQNNFAYPILTLFVYLCTFEIVPMLIAAKVLFVNS
jgi:hypothetical protein